MDDIEFEDFDSDELERLLHEAVNPAVPVDVFYAVLDRVIASASRSASRLQETPSGGDCAV